MFCFFFHAYSDDPRWDKVCGACGDGTKQSASAWVQAVASGDNPGAHHAGWSWYPKLRQHHPCGEDRPCCEWHVLPGPGTCVCMCVYLYF